MRVTVDDLEADAALAREAQMLAQVAASPGTRHLWLWRSPQCLVAPRKLGQNRHFAQTAAALAARGWPVHLRATGGDVTPQGPGIVNVTHVYAVPPTKAFDLEAEYDRLCRPIEDALGPGASRGWQAGAFCDGAHNVQFEGKKFAGTAMRFRPCQTDKTRFAVLAHALMLIAPPSSEAISALNSFLQGLGEDRVIVPDAHTGLPAALPQPRFLARLVSAFEDVIP